MKKHKRIFALLLAVMMMLSMYSIAGAAVEDTGFADVEASAWYAQDVQYCRDNGLMNGTDAAVFSPNATMSRAMLATVLYRMAGSPDVTGTDTFLDTENNQWYSDAILWASQRDIVGGYDNGRFGPDEPVLREQIAALLWRYAGRPAPEASIDFADEAEISLWAQDAVDWARVNGYINGDETNRFQPINQATRAEVSAILARYDRALQGEEEQTPEPTPQGNTTLIAYFSATGNTERIARQLEGILDADLYEITPETPYTSADLDYSNSGCRANQEQNDPTARPAISSSVQNMRDYDVVFLGYPIWWGQAPKIISTFLESYDFAGKTIVPFCTSGSSGIGSSADNLHGLAANADWMEGQRFSGNASTDEVTTWVDRLNLSTQTETAAQEVRVRLTFDGGEAVVVLENNETAMDFLAMLPATFTFEDYAGSEKISYLPRMLSTADAPDSYDPQIGDVTLYAPWGNLAIFYGEADRSSGLVPMGYVETGIELLAAMDGDFSVSVTPIE